MMSQDAAHPGDADDTLPLPTSLQAARAARGLDTRLLSHHPAGQACLDACTANGWVPESADVVRLVKLWSEVQEGLHDEVQLSKSRLNFARWLRNHGRINEGLDTAA